MSDDEGFEDHDKHIAKGKDENTEETNGDKNLERSPSVRKKLRALAFGHHKKSVPPKDAPKKKKSLWTSKLNSRHKHNVTSDTSEPSIGCSSCICTGYKKTEETVPRKDENMPRRKLSDVGNVVTLDNFQSVVSTVSVPSPQASTSADSNPFSVDDWDELARQERAKEIEEGIDPPPGFQSHVPSQNGGMPLPLSELTFALSQQLSLSIAPYPYLERLTEAAGFSQEFFKLWERHLEGIQPHPIAHSQIDYVHCLVPDLLDISNCSFYWGKMDRYEAEKLLDKRPEGTFLLRDSAQEEFLFSVSFRRYGRTLHARIEQWNHKFSFDSHDPGVFASTTVCGLIEHYKDPSCCMFFEPMLTLPLNRSFVFPLQHLCRSVICSCIMYDGVNALNLPKRLKFYLKEYHYKQRVRVRRFDYEQ